MLTTPYGPHVTNGAYVVNEMEVIYQRDSPAWWIFTKTSWRSRAIWTKLNGLSLHLVFSKSCRKDNIKRSIITQHKVESLNLTTVHSYSCATHFGHLAKLLHMFLNKSWNNLSHTPTLLHSQHAMQRTTWPPAVAWEPSHPHSWCVCMCVHLRAQNTGTGPG